PVLVGSRQRHAGALRDLADHLRGRAPRNGTWVDVHGDAPSGRDIAVGLSAVRDHLHRSRHPARGWRSPADARRALLPTPAAGQHLTALDGDPGQEGRQAGDPMGVAITRQWTGYAAAVRLGWAVSSNWTRPILFIVYSVLRPVSMALILAVMYTVITGNAAA